MSDGTPNGPGYERPIRALAEVINAYAEFFSAASPAPRPDELKAALELADAADNLFVLVLAAASAETGEAQRLRRAELEAMT